MYKHLIALAFLASPALGAGLEIDIAGEANGTIVIDLFEDVAPLHAAQITAIAAAGQYDNVVFHRVIDGFMAQTGDVQNGVLGSDLGMAGTGGSDLGDIVAEFSDLPFERGIVGMARAQNPNSANSQFFIMFEPGYFLNGQYTVVGQVTQGMEIVDAIKRGTGANGAVVGQHDVMAAVRVTP
jgi:cyclophilin family peptidyl-prolyl cis-trans isomerase